MLVAFRRWLNDVAARVVVRSRPLSAPSLPAASGAAATGDGLPVALVVDDDKPMRDAVALALHGRGYHVLSAASGEEALDMIDAVDQPPQLLVSDVVMPGIDGPALAAAVAQRLPDVPVIFISGYEHLLPATSRRLRRHQFCLAKPFSLRALETALHRVTPRTAA